MDEDVENLVIFTSVLHHNKITSVLVFISFFKI